MQFLPDWNSNRYLKGDHINSGAFGDVFKGFDTISHSPVALKCFTIYESYKFAYRELCILHHIKSHYLLQLISAHIVVDDGKLTKLWLALPLMDYDLFSVLHKKDLTFSFEANIKITYQILKGLQYLSDAGIIHRDLKPSNIGINRDYQIRLLDFGQSRDIDAKMTQNVQTIYYRAIEVFNGSGYTAAIDIWSAGCIFAELFTKKVLFKGKKIFDQVQTIIKITGLPTNNLYPDLATYASICPKENQLRNHLLNDVTNFVCHVDQPYGNKDGAENVLNLICSMLELDPAKRPTPLHAMNSPFYRQYYDLVKNYPTDKMAEHFVCDIENLTAEELQEKIVEEVNHCIANN